MLGAGRIGDLVMGKPGHAWVGAWCGAWRGAWVVVVVVVFVLVV